MPNLLGWLLVVISICFFLPQRGVTQVTTPRFHSLPQRRSKGSAKVSGKAWGKISLGPSLTFPNWKFHFWDDLMCWKIGGRLLKMMGWKFHSLRSQFCVSLQWNFQQKCKVSHGDASISEGASNGIQMACCPMVAYFLIGLPTTNGFQLRCTLPTCRNLTEPVWSDATLPETNIFAPENWWLEVRRWISCQGLC